MEEAGGPEAGTAATTVGAIARPGQRRDGGFSRPSTKHGLTSRSHSKEMNCSRGRRDGRHKKAQSKLGALPQTIIDHFLVKMSRVCRFCSFPLGIRFYSSRSAKSAGEFSCAPYGFRASGLSESVYWA